MSPISILPFLLLASVCADINQISKCGESVASRVRDKADKLEEFHDSFYTNGFGFEADQVDITVDPVHHEVTVERCEHKKFPNVTLIKTLYKLSENIDLDGFTAIEHSNGRLDMRAPYKKEFRKPTRPLDIVHSNEPYSSNDSNGIYINLTSSNIQLDDLEVMLNVFGHVSILTDHRQTIDDFFDSSIATKLDLPKVTIAQYKVNASVDLDEVTAFAYSDGILGIDLPLIKINQKPQRKIKVQFYQV